MDDMTKQILTTAAGSVVRHAMTTAAGALVTDGLVQAGDNDSFVKIGSGILMGLGALGLSWWNKSGQAQVAAMLKKMTAKTSTTAAVATAQALPTGAAVTKALVLFAVLLSSLVLAMPAYADPVVKKPPAGSGPLIELNGPCNPLGDSRASCQSQGSPAPGGATAAASLCDFNTFVQINPKNVVTLLQSCGDRLLADSQAALTSAGKANDQIATACLTPGTALVSAAVGTPLVPATTTTPEIPAMLPGPILIFQKFREFVNAGGITNCKAWVNNTVTAATASGL